MARVIIPVEQVTRDGLLVSTTNEVAGDAVNGHKFSNDGRSFISVRNAGATGRNVTVHIVRPGAATQVYALAAAAGARAFIGPLSKYKYNQSDGLVYVDVAHADVKLQVFTTGGR